jgi:hypothetical protein
VRQPASPMEGEVRLALRARGAYWPLVLGTIFPPTNLPSTAIAITDTLWPKWKAANVSPSCRAPFWVHPAGVLAARPLVDPDTFGDEPAVRPLMHDDRHAGSEWNVSDCDLWRHNDP